MPGFISKVMSPSPLHLFSNSLSLTFTLSLFLPLFQNNTFNTPAIVSYHRKPAIKRVWDNIKVFPAHTHLSLLITVLCCSHSSFSLSFCHFPLSLSYFLTRSFIYPLSLVKNAFVELNHYTFSFVLVFSLTPKWFLPNSLDQHFIPLCCSVLFFEWPGMGLKSRSHNPSLQGLEVAKGEFINRLPFKNHFLRPL